MITNSIVHFAWIAVIFSSYVHADFHRQNLACKRTNSALYMNFAAHRSNDELALLNAMINDPSQVDADLLVDLQKVVDGLDAFMHLGKQLGQATYLRSLIADGKIGWIGVEFSAEELGLRDERGRSLADRAKVLREALEKAGATQDLTDNMVLLYAGSAGRFVWFSDGNVRNKVHLVPMDNQEMKEQAGSLLDEVIVSKKLLEAYANKIRPALKMSVQTVLNRLTENGETWKELSDGEISESVAPLATDSGAVLFATNLFFKDREFSRVQKARNQIMINAILGQKGGGWISAGTKHGGLVEDLARACALQ